MPASKVLGSAVADESLIVLVASMHKSGEPLHPPLGTFIVRVRMYELEAGPASEGKQAVRIIALIQDCCKSSLLLGFSLRTGKSRHRSLQLRAAWFIAD